MKTLLTSDQLIDHMKNKGILFNIVSEEDAKAFLLNNNYYLKLSSYRCNYEKIPFGEHSGKYVDLEFAYLQDLSTIDMHLRYLIIKMCLDIEHKIKVTLLSKVETNPLEDGYNIVKEFKLRTPRVFKVIQKHKSRYSKDLKEKYMPDYPIWVLLELISFSDLMYFSSFYGEKYDDYIINNKLLNNVRDIRNASAHSNCLIYNLKRGNNIPIPEINDFLQTIAGITKSARKSRLSNIFIYDFTNLLYVYNTLIEEGALKNNRLNELVELFEKRMLRNKYYYEKNELILNSYLFLKKIVDKIAKV